MVNNNLKFSKNWNGKLSCNNYTTIRGFYFNPGTRVNVHLNDTLHHIAVVNEVMQLPIRDIPEWVYACDCGLTKSAGDTLMMRLTKSPNVDSVVYLMQLSKLPEFQDKSL